MALQCLQVLGDIPMHAQGGQATEPAMSPEHRRARDDLPLLWPQAIQPGRDQRLDSRRDAHLVWTFGDRRDQLLDEERVAARTTADPFDHRLG